jgi:transposase-like protein
MAIEVAPICKVPNCKNDAQISSKMGGQIRYMHTCSKHWNDLIPTEIKQLLKKDLKWQKK